MIYSCGRRAIDGCLVVFAARLTHGSGELEHVRVGFVTTRRAQVPALPQRDGPLSHGRRLESLVVEVLESYDAFDRSAVQNEPSPVPFLQKKTFAGVNYCKEIYFPTTHGDVLLTLTNPLTGSLWR